MEIDIDVYFWMVDRGLYDDDQRNKVDMERNKVKLHREHQQKFENAFYIGKIMLLLKKSIMKISKKPFTLDPGISNLKDNITSSTKQMNWNVVAKELKKFGIRVDADKKAKIIEGRWQSINEILGKLFDIDNGGIQSGRFQDGNISEIFNLNDRENSINGALNVTNVHNDSTNVSIDANNTSILLNNPKKGNSGQLEPIPKKLGSVQQSIQDGTSLQASPSKIQLSSQNSVNKKMLAISNSVTSLNDINESKDIAFSETTLEFILLSLSRSLQIKPKQAAGLLSNNHKFLVHIAVKGMKGNDYTKIQQWYLDIYQNTQLLIQLIDNEKDQNAMKLTLNILKCGLFSQNIDLAVNCSRLLSKIGQEINQIGGQLQGLAWDWLVNQSAPGPSNLPNDLSNVQVPDFSQNIDINNPVKGQDQPLNESGLSSLIFTYKRFSLDGGLIEHITPVLIHFSRNNHMELFSFHLKNQFSNDKGQFLSFVHELMVSHSKTSLFRDAIMNTGIFDDWINMTLRMADFDGINTVNDRIAAATFLADVWDLKSDQFEEGLNGGSDTAQAILSVLKKGCRDRSKMLRVVCFELMFNLLHVFASGRNQFAPIIYKSLTFLLIEFHQDNETREQLMRHFVALFQQIQTIPVAIISEPLIKQIEISQNGVNTLQIALTQNPNPSYVFNVFDFEFFNVVVHHKRVNLATSLQVVDLLINIATSNIFFANTSISIILEVIHKFSRDPTMHTQFSQITKTQIQMLEDSEKFKQKLDLQKKKQREAREKQLQETINKNKTNKYVAKKIQEEGQKQSQDQDQELEAASLARQTKEKLVVNLLKQILMFGNDLIKQNMRNQLLGSYSRVEKQLKVKSKSIKYLLDLYGEDIPKMLQYFVENEQESSTNTEKIDQQIEIASVGLIPTLQNQLVLGTDNGSSSSPPKRLNQKSAQHLEKVLKDIEKIKNNVTLKKDQKNLEEELKKARDDKAKSIAKKQVDQRKHYEHGVVPKQIRNFSIDNNKEANKSLDNQLQIKIIKAKDLDVSEIALEDEQRLIVPEINSKNDKKNNPILKKLKMFQLYDLRLEEQKDQDAVRFFVKKNLRIFRNLFNKYANTTGPVNQVQQTFDQLSQKNSLITVAELLKMLKEFQINNLQVSKDDVINMVRLINMEILKKKDKGQASLSVLEFEGFVEFMLQLAVHLYSFNAQLSPQQYFQQLFDYLKLIANKKGSSNAKLFDDPNQIQIGDSKLIQELNKRLQKDPNYQLPDGFTKVVEKEVVDLYVIPPQFPIDESQRVVIEVLDGFLNDVFGFHFLEPMSEIKEIARAKPNLRMQAKDKVIHELNQQQNLKSNYGPTPVIPSRRSRQNIRVSNSIDVNPIKQAKMSKLALEKLGVNNSINKSTFKSPRTSVPHISKPNLGIDLKLEVAKAPASIRQVVLETAYVMEEILYSVENGLDELPPPNFQQQQKRQILNRVMEDKIKKQENDEKQKQLDRQKLELRKKMLKDQLDVMRVEKDAKTKEDVEKKKQQEEKEKQRAIRKQQKQREDIQNMMKDLQLKKEEKMKKEEEDKKKEEEKKVKKSQREQSNVKQNLKDRKKKLDEEFKKIAEDRKASIQREEVDKVLKKEQDKQKSNQIKQLYAETKNKAKELKEKYRQEFDNYSNSPEVREVFNLYEKALLTQFEQYCKMDSTDVTKLSYNSFLKLGNKLSITPTIITSQDYIYIYKTIMRAKKEISLQTPNDSISDADGTKLNYSEFKEALIKIACLGKFKLGGLSGTEEDMKEKEERLKDKFKLAVSSVGIAKQLTKNKIDQSLNISVTSDQKEEKDKIQNALGGGSIFEKAFDVSDMTGQTIENLLKHIGVKEAGFSKMNTMNRNNSIRQSKVQNNLKNQVYDSINERENFNESQLEQLEEDVNL
ncbi:UNKNOWN [Stylonychia lemnae]|uniref:Uncharacterized protein n=1 Tax=Stylonychia lemnae TaxID=5949 RepID=A0A078AD98_STYLE|nr:UNKNOWN [Stylonychia lemnae]|eukprot:CDW79816.1 UNKNOWN [Stylonychia lemnae]